MKNLIYLLLTFFIFSCQSGEMYEVKKSPLSSDPTLIITSPSNYKTYDSSPATVVVNYVISDKTKTSGINWYVDDQAAQKETDEDGTISFDLTKGQHRITGVLLKLDGTEYTSEDSMATVIVRVSDSCVTSSDCNDGNPCTKDSCVLVSGQYKCKYADDTSKPNCCNGSDFDCDFGYKCVAGTSYDTCVECTQDSDCGTCMKCENNACVVDTATAGCCETNDDCKFPCEVCNTATHQCLDQGIENCCVSVSDCANPNPASDGDCVKTDCVDNKCKTVIDYSDEQNGVKCCLYSNDCPDYPCQECGSDHKCKDAPGDCCTRTIKASADDPYGCVESDPAGDCVKHLCYFNKCTEVADLDDGANCCVKDTDCPNYPCDKCVDNQCTYQAGCCLTTSKDEAETQFGDAKYGCFTDAEMASQPCKTFSCVKNECKSTLKAYGCCTQDSDCAASIYADKHNVCNSNSGKCVIPAGESTGTCYFGPDADHPDCCLKNSDCNQLLIEGKVEGKSFPEYFGKCEVVPGQDWKKCSFYKNTNYCKVPSTVPEIVINEFMANPSDIGDKCEWIELFNTTDHAINIKNWKIKDAAGDDITITTEDYLVPYGGYVLLAKESAADPDNNCGIKPDFTYPNTALQLNNSSNDTITLKDADGNVVDQITYNYKKHAKAGYSAAKTSPYEPNTDSSHWIGYIDSNYSKYRYSYNGTDFGTPKGPNIDVVDPNPTVSLCDDSKPCTLDICNAKAPYVCSHYYMKGCCDQNALGCNDGNQCTVDSCNTDTHQCYVSATIPGCCLSDADCESQYPSWVPDDLKADFDKCVLKQCIGKRCRFRKDPQKPNCCVSADFPVKYFACTNYEACVITTCEDKGNGYKECSYDWTGGGAKECCDQDSDCDDSDPKTDDKCVFYENGTAKFECSHEPSKTYCDNTFNSDCNDNNPCTTDSCVDNVCQHTKKAGCCVTNGDCNDGKMNTIDKCCIADGKAYSYADPNGVSDPDCNGAQPNTCVNVKAWNYCDTASDCPAPTGTKECFTPVCIGHVCRYGLPWKTDGQGNKCCRDEKDCNDFNDCTVDTCEDVGGAFKICKHTSKGTDCCSETSDCCGGQGQPPCLDGCTKWVCKLDSEKGYKTCQSIDLKPFGLCCETNDDCDDGNICTTDLCDKNICRHIKVANCCTTKFMCPSTWDSCAEKTCNNNNECELKDDVTPCTANLPYVQKFNFKYSAYNNYSDFKTIGWSTINLDGGNSAWALANLGGPFNNKHIKFENANSTNGDCVVLPKFNTAGKTKITLQWNNLVTITGGTISLKIKARKDATTQWSDAATDIATINGANDTGSIKTVEIANEEVLNSSSTEIALCMVASNFAGKWEIDNVKVAGGSAPKFETTIGDQSVAKGGSLLIQGVKASDDKYLNFSLIDAPSFVTLSNLTKTSDGFTYYTSIDINIVDAQCPSQSPYTYTITLQASDGTLVTNQTFTLTITGCQ